MEAVTASLMSSYLHVSFQEVQVHIAGQLGSFCCKVHCGQLIEPLQTGASTSGGAEECLLQHVLHPHCTSNLTLGVHMQENFCQNRRAEIPVQNKASWDLQLYQWVELSCALGN